MTAPAKKLDRPDTSTATPAEEEVTEEPTSTDALLTTREVAEKLSTDPRTLRKFLRDDSTIENAGKGNRYGIAKGQVKDMKKRFANWTKARQAEVDAKVAKAEAAPKKAAPKKTAPKKTAKKAA